MAEPTQLANDPWVAQREAAGKKLPVLLRAAIETLPVGGTIDLGQSGDVFRRHQ